VVIAAGNLPQAAAYVEASNDLVAIVAQGDVTLQSTLTSTATNAYTYVQGGRTPSVPAAALAAPTGLSIQTNGSLFLTGGAAPNSSSQLITTGNADLTVDAATGITFQSGTATAQPSGTGAITVNGGTVSLASVLDIRLFGGSGTFSPVNILAGEDGGAGDISITSMSGNIQATGGSGANSGVNLFTSSLGSGSLTLEAINGTADFGSVNAGTLAVTGMNNPILVQAQEITFTGSTLKTALGDVTLLAEGSGTSDIGLFDTKIKAQVPGADGFLAIADRDITLGTNTRIELSGGLSSGATFVVDNATPMCATGAGAFNYLPPICTLPGANVSVNGGAVFAGYVRIWTSVRSQNNVPSDVLINGLSYMPGLMSVDSNQEQWNQCYPTVPAPSMGTPFPDGTQHFTIYYKEM
jgi:hypothetical protein